MWTSDDGLRWRPVAGDGGPFHSAQPGTDAGRVSLDSVAAGPAGYVAVGADGPCDGAGDRVSTEAAAWTSPDGRVWDRVQAGPVFAASDPGQARGKPTEASYVVAVRSGFVVIGEYEGAGAVWISGSPGG
jgi:hypothetical protein